MNIEDDIVFFLEDEEKGANNMVYNPNLLSTGAIKRIVRHKSFKKKEKLYIDHGV